MSINVKGPVQKFLWKFGYDVVKAQSTQRSFTLRRRTLMRSYNVNVVFDVGASGGGFAKGLRDSGYAGRTCSTTKRPAGYCKWTAFFTASTRDAAV